MQKTRFYYCGMLRKSILFGWLLLGILYSPLSLGQTRPAGRPSHQAINKLIKEAKKRVEAGGDFTEEELNAALEKIVPSSSKEALKELEAEPQTIISKLNQALLASLPRRSLTETELKSHINNLYNSVEFKTKQG